MKHPSLIQRFFSFLFLYVELMYFGNTHAQTIAMCERQVINTDPCIEIETFNEFKLIVEKESGMILFCPFNIYKDSSEVALITSNLDLICKESKRCFINGPTTHIEIADASAQVFVQGFVFSGANIAAVHITPGAQNIQMFCNCHFNE